MNADDAPVTGGNTQLPATVAPPRSRQPVPVRAPDESTRAGEGSRPLPGSGHRLWWRWLLIGLLVAVSAGVTALFGVTLATDLMQRHWAQAVDSTREAVPAAVGWGALFMIFFIGGAPRAAPRSPVNCDDVEATELRDVATHLRAAAEDDAVRQAEECVQSLTTRLRMLVAGEQAEPACAGSDRSPRPQSVRPETLPPEMPRAGTPRAETPRTETPRAETPRAEMLPPGSLTPDPSLARQVAETSARLERARQWLISAQAALAASRETAAPLMSQPGDRSDGPSGRPDL
jgi:hypothetical protein